MRKTTDINQTTPSLVSLRPLTNERRNSILMTRHNPDLGSASDWLKQISHTAPSILPILRRSSALVSQTLFRGETSGGVGLDTDITKNRLNMFPETPDFFLKISKFFSKYLKNIWLHVINITVTTQQYSLSSKMATQISVNFRKLYSCTAYNKTKTISHKVNLIYSALQPQRRLGHCTLIQAEFVKDHEVLEV